MAGLDIGDYDAGFGTQNPFPPPPAYGVPPPPAETTSPSAGGSSSEGVMEAVGLSTITMVAAMVLYMSVGHQISHSSKYLGEGMSAALTGLLLGFCLLLCSNVFISESTLQQLLSFDHSSFFTFYLPPIILFAGLSVRKKAFFKQLPTIASLGIVGTYIAFAVIAVLTYAVSKVFAGITLADCLALGAIFATTDSVAVLQVLEQDRAPLLFSFVFGEGVINDATTVALLRTVQGLGVTPSMTFKTVLIIFGKFIYLFAISLVMGIAFGFAASLLLKKYQPSGLPQAVGMVGATAYLSYLVSDHLGLSGIVSLFCCSVTMSHYALHSLTKTQRAATLSSFETLSYLAEGSIFVYVGLDALDPEKWAQTNVGRAILLSIIMILLLLFSRAVFCFPILCAHNYFSSERVSAREMIIAWWAGGMRGAVSVALVYFYYDSDAENGCGRDCSTLISMTLIVVLFSTLVFGAVTKPLLDIMLGSEVPRSESSAGGLEMTGHPADKGAKGNVLRLPDATQPRRPDDDGYETDVTTFSDAGYTTEGNTPTSEAQGLLQEMEAGESPIRVRSPQPRPPGSILKGLAPRALLASPDASPKAGDEHADFASLAEVQGLAGASVVGSEHGDAGELPTAPRLIDLAAAEPAQGGQRGRPHVKFAETHEQRLYCPSPQTASSLRSDPAGLRRASSAEDLSSVLQQQNPPPALRMPIRLGRGGGRPQTIQLAEWWADFDEKFMRPVFSRGDSFNAGPEPEACPSHGAREHGTSGHSSRPNRLAEQPQAPASSQRRPGPHADRSSAMQSAGSMPQPRTANQRSRSEHGDNTLRSQQR